MMDKLRLVHLLRFATGALLFIWAVGFLAGSGGEGSRYASAMRAFRDQRAVFVEDFLTHDVNGDFRPDAIMDLCAAKQWTPGLVLTCDAVPGGLAETKNGILSCVRLAMEMGAEVVLPNVMLRSPHDFSVVVPHDVGPRRGVPLDHFFDRAHLVDTLATACPALKVHASVDDFYNQPSFLEAVRIDPYRLPDAKLQSNPPGNGEGKVLDDAVADVARRIHRVLDKRSPRRARQYPFHVEVRPTPSFALQAAVDPPHLHDNFGRLVRPRADLRALSAAVLFNLQKALGVAIDPRKGIDIDAFVAVELRTHKDPRRFPAYAVQASDALAFADASKIATLYLMEGARPDDARQFADRARDFNRTVVGKDDLLDGPDLATLRSLSYDERFLVDYEVALRAGLFVGSGHSALAWNIALRREHAYGDAGKKDAKHLSGNVRWHNQYSTLYGREQVGDDLRKTIWP